MSKLKKSVDLTYCPKCGWDKIEKAELKSSNYAKVKELKQDLYDERAISTELAVENDKQEDEISELKHTITQLRKEIKLLKQYD